MSARGGVAHPFALFAKGGAGFALDFHMLGAGVPSDDLSTTTANTLTGGKFLSCGYACADKC
jgi:hypothetical protein